ncbi:MAG: metallophosphoesterase family protein [Candidatus Promineifilaceae bacterium]|nr:metallophosphoesterase family protein [Candidatus Promineifilaceae bacterium]
MGIVERPWSGPADRDIIDSFLHKALLLFHAPEDWSAPRFVAAGLLVLAGSGLIWRLVSGSVEIAALATVTIAAFVLVDALLFALLPQFRFSYGPWRAQLTVLLTARTLVGLTAAFLALVLGDRAGLLLNLTIQLAGLAALLWGTLVEPLRLAVTELNVSSRQVPQDAEPIRILHISDLHIERAGRREARLQELVARIPVDLIVLTGDYLNLSYTRDARAREEARGFLQQLQAPHGVYAVLGSPPVDERDIAPTLFEGTSVRLLFNEVVDVDLGSRGALTLVGLDCTHRMEADAAQLTTQLERLAVASNPRLLLYHGPDLMPAAVQEGIDLYLCGHTHGGQVRLPGYGALLTSSQLGKRYEMGHYHERNTHLYVSRGVGFEGLSAPRVRLFSPPEITLVKLHSTD